MTEDFFHLPPTGVNDTGGAPWAGNMYLREFSEKFEAALMVYSGAWGKLIHEENQKSKISWRCPFKIHVLGLTSLVIDRRGHIGGNCYDYIDQHGIRKGALYNLWSSLQSW